jgi:creatinine amidohydrolase
MERHIGSLNHLEFKQAIENGIETVLIPVGTIEAHGITPLGTDVIIPEAMAEKIAPGLNALVAPAVPYGITRGLVGHPGTIRIRPETFKAYIGDILESLAGAGRPSSRIRSSRRASRAVRGPCSSSGGTTSMT